jgi:Tfp pilus assembly protein PilF
MEAGTVTNACSWISGRRAWLIILGIGLVTNIAFVIESHREEVFRVPTLDAATYHKKALSINAGDASSSAPFWQPPLYPYVLSAIYRIAPDSVFGARICHSLLGVLTILVVFALAKRVAPPPWAFLAALTACFYGPLLFFSSQLLPAGLATFLDTLVLLLGLNFLHKPTPRRGLVCGAALGLAALAVPNILVLLPVLILCALRFASSADNRRLLLAPTFSLAAGALICISPVTIRNYVVSGELVPISTNGGINLYIGNNSDASATIGIRPGLDWNRLVAKPFEKGGATSESEAQNYFLRRVATYAFSEPWSFVRGIIVKTWHLVNSREIPRNIDVYTFRNYSVLLRSLVWRIGSFCFPFGLVLPLAILGMATTVRQNRDCAILVSAIAVYAASVVLFFPTTRYVLPMIPCVIVFAVLGVRAIVAGFRDRTPGRVILVSAWVVLVLLLNLPAELPTDAIDFEAELLTNVGVGLQTRDSTEKAIGYYERALAISPEYADAHFYMGTAFRDAGKGDRAMTCHRAALEHRPDHHRAMNDLAVLLSNEDRIEEAVSLLRRSIALDPANKRTMYNLAVGLLRLDKLPEANEWLKKAGKPTVSRAQLEMLQQQLKGKKGQGSG